MSALPHLIPHDEQSRQFAMMVTECSAVYDIYAILEALTYLAPQGVTFDQVYKALMALQPKAA